MSAIGPGDWVECVDARARYVCPETLTLGAIYRVVAVEPDFCGTGPGVWLQGVVSSGWSGGFHADRFRPIYRPKADFIVGLLQPAPAEPEGVNA